MLKKATFFGTLAGFGFLLGAISGVLAAEMPATHDMPSQSSSTQFQRIDQPLANKVAVMLAGLGLMGLELWWFLLSKPKSQQIEARGGIQEVTITVDGSYDPSRIVVQAGQPVRLNFLRRDPSICLEEVRLPDFHIAQNLALIETTNFSLARILLDYSCLLKIHFLQKLFRLTDLSKCDDVTTGKYIISRFNETFACRKKSILSHLSPNRDAL